MKKIFTMMAAVMVAANMMAYDAAVAGNEYSGAGFAVVGLEDGTVAVSSIYLADDATEASIPASLNVTYDKTGEKECSLNFKISAVGYSEWKALYVERNSVKACNVLEKVTIAEGITSIGTEAFATWVWDGVTDADQFLALSSIELPSTLTSIGNYAFNGDDALISIICKAATAPTLGSDVFKGLAEWNTIINNCKVYVPSETAKETYNTSEWSYWQEFYNASNVIVDAGIITAAADVVATKKAVKVVENGQLFILKDGVRYNVLGSAVR